jgi:rhodanese-related sulfurtransferase
MNKNYIILAILFLLLAGGYFFLPQRENFVQIEPEQLMRDIVQTSRYVTTDQVAHRIIEQDPTLMLVDVRNEYEHLEYSLPNALNIPLDSILSDDYQDYLGVEDMSVIFFSNDDILADQAWVIAKRMGYESLYVMKGGLNCWISTIIRPEAPEESAPKDAFEQYNFRRGASMYFTGAEVSTPAESGTTPVTVKRKKKSNVAEGGC